ncbi:MAG: OmpH family outer membrane protein [Bacteroidales bacterium]|nr:OmpH family outer membrane protein [Bacteroidales bacterium]
MNKSYFLRTILLVTAVTAIGVLLASGCKNEGAVTSDVTKAAATNGIVFVELDSVIANFNMAEDLSAKLQDKQKNSEAELAAKSQAFDRDVRDYQTKAQKGLITRATAADMEQNLSQQQQNLLSLRDEMAYNLNEESMVAQRQVLEYINQYLAEYNQTHNYQYILAKQFPGPILFSDATFDITSEVTKGLNAKYLASKAK